MLLNAAKCQGYSFYHFCAMKVKPTELGKFTLHPPRVGLNKPSAEIAGLFKYVWFLADKKH